MAKIRNICDMAKVFSIKKVKNARIRPRRIFVHSRRKKIRAGRIIA